MAIIYPATVYFYQLFELTPMVRERKFDSNFSNENYQLENKWK